MDADNEKQELENVLSNPKFNHNQFTRNIFESSTAKKDVYQVRDVLAKVREENVSKLKDFVYAKYTEILSVSNVISNFEESLNPLKDNLEKQIRNVRNLKKLPDMADILDESNETSIFTETGDYWEHNEREMSNMISELMDLSDSCLDDELMEIINLLDSKNRDFNVVNEPKNVLNRLHVAILNNQFDKTARILASSELEDYLCKEHSLIEKNEIKKKINCLSTDLTLSAEKLFIATNRMFVPCGPTERRTIISSMIKLGCASKACDFFLEYHRKQLFDFYDFMSRTDSETALEKNTIDYFNRVNSVVQEFNHCFKMSLNHKLQSVLDSSLENSHARDTPISLRNWWHQLCTRSSKINFDNCLLCWLMAVTRIFIESFMTNIKNRKLPFTVAPNQYRLFCTDIKIMFEKQGLTLNKYIDLCIHRHLESILDAFTNNMIKLLKEDQKNESWQDGLPIDKLYSFHLIKSAATGNSTHFQNDGPLYHLPKFCNSLTKLIEIFVIPCKEFNESQLLSKVVNMNLCKILVAIVQNIKESHSTMQNNSYFGNYSKFLFHVFLPYISLNLKGIDQYIDYKNCESYLSSLV